MGKAKWGKIFPVMNESEALNSIFSDRRDGQVLGTATMQLYLLLRFHLLNKMWAL